MGLFSLFFITTVMQNSRKVVVSNPLRMFLTDEISNGR